MTKDEAVELAAQLPELDYLAQSGPERNALYAVFWAASPTMRKRVLAKLLEQAEFFRDPSVPGHDPHYAIHLQTAAWAAENFNV